MYGSSAFHDEMFLESIFSPKIYEPLKASSCQTAEHIMPARPMNNLMHPKSNNAQKKTHKIGF